MFTQGQGGRMMKEKIDLLIRCMNESKKTVFFGGAGVSTESGIPDFRSKDGLYNQHDVQFDKYSPEYLLSSGCLYDRPEVFYEFYNQKLDTRGIKPNITHKMLARLEAAGKLSSVITQNIDGLHQMAGSRRVIELHGTTQRNYCVHCHREYGGDFIFQSENSIPECPACGHMVRPDVTLYGEQLPGNAVREAEEELREADMLMIGGTSLTVYPAAYYIHEFRGNHLVVINRDQLQVKLNTASDISFACSLGEVFSELERRFLEIQ